MAKKDMIWTGTKFEGVDAVALNGTDAYSGSATNKGAANSVANSLILQIAGSTKNTFNGSAAQTFNIPNASTTQAGVMTTDMVTKLNGIVTGANNYTHPDTHPASMITGLHDCATTGNAASASRVANNLTLQIAGATKNTFNGSSAQTFNIPNASTSAAGVMTTDMVTKLNGIATGATKNVVDTAMSSTSTNAVQNKVIYAYIQEQLKKAGDYMGKTMINVSTSSIRSTDGYTYTNAKGGLADFVLEAEYGYDDFDLIVDGVTIVSNRPPSDILKQIDTTDKYIYFELKIPFTSTFTVKYYSDDNSRLQGFIYVNK